MGAREAVATGPPSPRRATVGEKPAEYVVKLDVPDFGRDELTLETVGRRVTVRGNHLEQGGGGDEFRLHERLEESFRLPDDADPDCISAVYNRGELEVHVRRKVLRHQSVPIERANLAGTGPQGC